MSYDLNIFRLNGASKRFTLKELEEQLHTVFKLFEHDYTHEDGIEWFTIHYRDKSPNNNWEFHYQKDKGCYWTGCSYGTDENTIKDFRKVVRDVAVLLNAQIQDPQLGEEIIDPQKFDINDLRSIRIRTLERHIISKVIMKDVEPGK